MRPPWCSGSTAMGDVAVGEGEEKAGEAHHPVPGAGHEVDALLAAGLGQEQAERPRRGAGALLDAQHGAQVPAPHGRDHDRRPGGGDVVVGAGHVAHAEGRVDQLISASGLRR